MATLPPGMMLVQRDEHERLSDRADHLEGEIRRLNQQLESMRQGRGALAAKAAAATAAAEQAAVSEEHAVGQLTKAERTRDRHVKSSERYHDACEVALGWIKRVIDHAERHSSVNWRALTNAKAALAHVLDPEAPEHTRPHAAKPRR